MVSGEPLPAPSADTVLAMLRRTTLTFMALALQWFAGCASAPPGPSTAPTQAKPQPTADGALPRSIDAYVAQFGRHWGEAFRFHGYVLERIS